MITNMTNTYTVQIYLKLQSVTNCYGIRGVKHLESTVNGGDCNYL